MEVLVNLVYDIGEGKYTLLASGIRNMQMTIEKQYPDQCLQLLRE